MHTNCIKIYFLMIMNQVFKGGEASFQVGLCARKISLLPE